MAKGKCQEISKLCDCAQLTQRKVKAGEPQKSFFKSLFKHTKRKSDLTNKIFAFFLS